MKAINDALSLRGLEDRSNINVPIQVPSTWKEGPWTDYLHVDVRFLAVSFLIMIPTSGLYLASSSVPHVRHHLHSNRKHDPPTEVCPIRIPKAVCS